MPYYVPVPDKVILKPEPNTEEPFFIEFIKFIPKRHPEESQGTNIDDRLGTYVRSKVRVVFLLQDPPPDEAQKTYEDKAKRIVNRTLDSVRYVAFDHTIRRVERFDKVAYQAWQLHDNGTAEPFGVWAEGASFGPFGIKIIGVLSRDALQNLYGVFNGLSSINPAWHLVLDANYHISIGDLPRAILDLATALEINVPRLIEVFSKSNPKLTEIDTDGAGIYANYDTILLKATGHSLHETPDLFAKLEYIRGLRNSIAHD